MQEVTSTLRLHTGLEEMTFQLHALHVPTLGQTLVSLGCINRRGGVVFDLSKVGVPTLTKDGVRTHPYRWCRAI